MKFPGPLTRSGETRQRGTGAVIIWTCLCCVPQQPKVNSPKAGQDSAAAVLGETINAPLAKPAKTTAAKTKPAKPAPASPKSAGQRNCLDAAAKVLGEAQEPMSTKAMIEQMAAKKYWTSPGGKTPAATRYSAILREINTKGKESRFKKTERGHFALA